MLKNNYAVWGKNQVCKINSGLAFRLKITANSGDKCKLNLIAKQVYKVILNGKTIGYGPERTAHGYVKQDVLNFKLNSGANYIVVEVLQPYIKNYYLVKETAYFCAEVYVNGKIHALTNDFTCYDLTDRITKIQRYSIQRTFAESYNLETCRTNFYLGKDVFPTVEVVKMDVDSVIKKDCSPLTFNTASFTRVEVGALKPLSETPKYELRANDKPDKYEIFESREIITDTVSRFTYASRLEKAPVGYELYKYSRNVCGFICVDLEVIKDAEIYLVFDEILINGKIQFERSNCANTVKYLLKKGKYHLETFEPYGLKYLAICQYKGEVDVKKAYVKLYENSNAYKFKSSVGDKKLDLIIKSAQHTYAQNSVDVLTDCPTRERAGWINDAWFTRYSTYLYGGNHAPFTSLLRAYTLAPQNPELNKGEIPMCYPSDYIKCPTILACGMWFILNVYAYKNAGGDSKLIAKSLKKVNGFLKFISKFENEFNLLEDLPGWVFVEWSMASDDEFVKGVNFPTNMLYYKALLCASELTGNVSYSEKANTIKQNILKLSFNGEFFEDNAVREDKKLVLKNHITQACQYYAFETGVAETDTHIDLYNKIKTYFSPLYKSTKYNYVHKANVIIGFLARIKLLLINNEYDLILNEIKKVYYPMAERTGTLWEHFDERASCNHGIASFVGVVAVSALTGFVGVKDGVAIFKKVPYKHNCRFVIPYKNDKIKVTVKNNDIKIETKTLKYEII